MSFDWPALMKAGLVGLRLDPDAFWRLTPAELQMLLDPGDGTASPLNRSGLDALIAAYPDEKEGSCE